MFNLRGVSAQANTEKINFIPVEHASFLIVADNKTIYVDPTRDVSSHLKIQSPDIILVTHDHFDHFNKETIGILKNQHTVVVGPKKVIDQLSYGEALNNGESKIYGSINIEAVPAYNITPDRLQYHPNGVGNGYIVTVSGKRIYISGDTEDTPEMRALKNIDYAFVCMNLPYTMSIEQAASGVLAFRPKVVFPYHYRQGKGFADINKFKQLVARDKDIEVRMLNWYK